MLTVTGHINSEVQVVVYRVTVTLYSTKEQYSKGTRSGIFRSHLCSPRRNVSPQSRTPGAALVGGPGEGVETRRSREPLPQRTEEETEADRAYACAVLSHTGHEGAGFEHRLFCSPTGDAVLPLHTGEAKPED